MKLSAQLGRFPWAYVAALVFGLSANFFFTGEFITRFNNIPRVPWERSQTLGLLCLLAALLLSWRFFGPRDDLPVRTAGVAAGEAEARWPGWWRLLPAGLLYLGSSLTYLAHGETALVRWMWAGSLVALLLPFLGGFGWKKIRPLPFWEFILLFLVIVLAFTVRFVDLTQVPLHVDNDVSIMGLLSKSLVEKNNWTMIGMAPTNHQYSEHQIHSIGMRLFGLNHYGLVMLSVLAGTATCVLTYFLGRALFNRWVGFVAAGLLSFDYVHIHFSRILFGPVTTFFVTLGSLLLVLGLKGGQRLYFACSGISLGMGLLCYYSGRVGPVIVLVAFVYWWLNRKTHPWVGFGHWFLLAAGMLATFGPNLAYGLAYTDELHGRGNSVILWTDIAWKHLSLKYESGGSFWVVIFEQCKRTLLAPFYYPDESTICYLHKPMLGGLAAAGLLLGTGFLLRRWKTLPSLYLLGWVGLVFLLGGVLTIDPPFWPHLNIAMPALALIAGLGLERWSRRLILWGGARLALIVPSLLAGLVLFLGVHQWEVYYRFARDHAGGRIQMVRQIERLPAHHRAIIISPSVNWGQEAFQFFTSHLEGLNLTVEELVRNPPPIDKPTSFFVFVDADQKAIEHLLQTYPGATQRLYRDGWNIPAFTQIQTFPRGHVENPQLSRREADVLWNQPGWIYVSAVLAGLLGLGWWSLRSELKGRRAHG